MKAYLTIAATVQPVTAGILIHVHNDQLAIDDLVEQAAALVRGGLIQNNGKHVGWFTHQSVVWTPQQIIAHFPRQDKIAKVVTRMRLPEKVNFHWIQEMTVKPEHRRKGNASGAINSILLPGVNVVAAMAGRVLGNPMNSKDRIKAYKAMGFTHVDDGGDYFFKKVEIK